MPSHCAVSFDTVPGRREREGGRTGAGREGTERGWKERDRGRGGVRERETERGRERGRER